MNKINHIIDSINKAESNSSKLTSPILSIPGESGKKSKHLLNNLANYPNINHLEIGVKYGATLVPTLFKNKVNSSYAIDIDKRNVQQILSYKEKFNISFNFFNEDCFQLDLSKINNKINLYLFDGDHTYDDHYKSLTYYYPILADEFIFVVDDWLDANDTYFKDWKHIQEATLDAINDLKLNILFQQHKGRINPQIDNWWGGYWISLLKKY